MFSVEAARARMCEAVWILPSETIAIDLAGERVLAESLYAKRDQPPFAASAMDGFALAGAAERYVLMGEAAAGRAFSGRLQSGEAVRISTGAPLPEGADRILVQEEARREDGAVRGPAVAAGAHVRPRGGDFSAGDALLERGRVLDPVALALAAGAGFAHLSVVRKPRVVVMAGGEEVVAPGAEARADQVYESGSFAVCGLARRWGALAERGGILADDEDAIGRAAADALKQADLLVLIGGASVGPHDHARAALSRLGLRELVDRVAVKPGKPTWFGVAPQGKFVLGLPGNPASAIVCAHLFLRAVLARLLGRDEPPRLRRHALAAPLPGNGARETYLRARADDADLVHVLDNQDSSALTSFAAANALVVRRPHAPPASAGEAVEALMLE